MFLNSGKVSEELVVEQIAIAVSAPNASLESVIIAYKAGMAKNEFGYIVVPPPKNGIFKYASILEIIKNAERVNSVYYKYSSGTDKPIYVLRGTCGKVIDIVERDSIHNRYVGNFSEIAMTGLKLSIEGIENKQAKNVKRLCRIKSLKNDYKEGTFEYALVNACNACMLGNLFDGKDFDFITYTGEKVKIEIRSKQSECTDDDVLSVTPAMDQYGYCSGIYVTEPFEYIDGKSRTRYGYNIVYDSLANCYLAERN